MAERHRRKNETTCCWDLNYVQDGNAARDSGPFVEKGGLAMDSDT